jgi:hypothetical protein
MTTIKREGGGKTSCIHFWNRICDSPVQS